ncbi:cytochrome P450 [Rhodobacter capsulatus]|uniref:cytochrome P450 n=1 Tax=Rhodobacter capsulatus TaxID=1061 RepID=UPI004025981C
MGDLGSFNSLAPLLRDDPYPVYAQLRARAPVFWTETEQAWVLLRHQEVSAAFCNPGLLTLDLGQFVAEVSQALGDHPVELLRLLDMAIFFRNPPAHGPLRALVARLLALRPQAACAAEVARIARALHAPLARDGGLDLMTGFADPLPPLFMGWLLGLADADALWLAKTLSGVPVILNRGASIRDFRAAELRLTEAHAFLRAEIVARRLAPRDDGLTQLVSRNDASEAPFDDDRLTALTSFVFMAGFETTSALIGNALWLLLDHPDQCDRVAADRKLLASAAEEALRLEAPIQQVRRRAATDMTLAGQEIRAGQQIVLMIAAANRDPQAYPDPDLYLPGRTGRPVQSFGGGLHHCLGAWVARMEAEIALGTVLDGPRPRLCIDRPGWRALHNQRRMTTLPVQV